MIRDGLIGRGGGFRDLYDENIEPRMSDEYFYGMRWFHMLQKTSMKLYDKDGYYIKTYPMVNVTARTGFFAVDNNMQHIIQGSFRQLGGSIDWTVDYDRLHRLMEVYEDPKDIELMAALWLEKPVEGGRIPETLYCLLTEQYRRSIKSDRHCNPLTKCSSSRIGKLDLTPWKESD
ncbi:unnamed protein product [Spodoptera littoralis]|uniref:Uncharacterized protein n=1 Tax=Spodoptera littoralis TaxID=7109 RepID=A0A9P0ID74_SPOLI|nr:unnamed protein product [Spodoptera littoralis]CAH1644593.1 unnamed protein product [Spodoptera littoralis]